MSTQDLSPFESRWLTQAIADIEQRNGRLPDQDELREAAATANDAEGQIVARGVLLAEREGLVERLHRWLSISRTLMLSLTVLIFLSGVGAALGFEEGGSRQINALWALLALLAPNLIMLIIWTVGFVSAGRRHFGIGALWQWAISHFPGKASELVQPFLTLHDKAGLTRWWFGTVTHGAWAIATLGMLVGLVAALAFRGYSFIWETTWLTQETLVSTVHFFGTVPALIGFPIPDESILERSSAPLTDEIARRAWTSWFIGCLTVYGFLPRLVLWFLCWLRISVGRRALRLHTSSREYMALTLNMLAADTERQEPTIGETRVPAQERGLTTSPLGTSVADHRPATAHSSASVLPSQIDNDPQDIETTTQTDRIDLRKLRSAELHTTVSKSRDFDTTTEPEGRETASPRFERTRDFAYDGLRLLLVKLLIAYRRLPWLWYWLSLVSVVIYGLLLHRMIPPRLWFISLSVLPLLGGLIYARRKKFSFLPGSNDLADVDRKAREFRQAGSGDEPEAGRTVQRPGRSATETPPVKRDT